MFPRVHQQKKSLIKIHIVVGTLEKIKYQQFSPHERLVLLERS